MKEVFLELNPSLLNRKINFFLDEIQNIEGWEKFCRRAVERENINIFVSGSSSKMMPFEIHTELRGRSWSMEIFPFSKDLLFRCYAHFIESMLVFEIKKFSESLYKRLRNPAKIYLIDTGLAKKTTSKDSGRLLENIVFLELKRRQKEVFYFQEKNKFLSIQVCYELNDENFSRETKGVIEACKYIGTKEGVILTLDEENNIVLDGINIKVLPVWKWILEKS